jgi:primosomal protein N' (replication factor Y)
MNFASQYYIHALGETIIPTVPQMWKKPDDWEKIPKKLVADALKKKKKSEPQIGEGFIDENLLNDGQKLAIEKLRRCPSDEFRAILLQGQTGSGKTAVFLNWLSGLLEDTSAQALLLVPEINLTPQLERRVRAYFPDKKMVVLHSGVSEKVRGIAWYEAMTGKAQIILGTRLAALTPLPNLRAIVVDEEHDGSYKQQDGLRYNARDLAIWRGVDIKIPVLLTSATPSSETWQKVIQKKITLFELTKKAKEGATISQLHLIDLNQARKNKTIDTHGLTSEIKKVIQTTWEKNKQILVFINRRGYSPILHCGSCQWKSECKKCSAWMVVHKKKFGDKDFSLQCHHCGLVSAPPASCPSAV